MPWESNTVEVDGLKLHYTRTGGDHPALVLAHGFSDDGLCWAPVADALQADYDIIMVDSRGHGRSDGPESGYSQPELANDLAGVIKALGLKKPMVLGHSMGAATALGLAAQHPDLPGAILLEDPPAGWMQTGASPSAEWLSRTRASITSLKRKTRDELIAQQRAQSPGWSEAELGPWADSKLRLSFNVLNRTSVSPTDWAQSLGNITCPTLLITADIDQGAIVSPAAAVALKELIPQLEVVHIPDAGHSIRRDQFLQYVQVVRTFLEQRTMM
jgi:N-formylmaleamate deformylase